MNLKINEGITSTQIEDLIEYSNNDMLILKSTKDRKRFKDKTAVVKWFGKRRKIYTLTNENGKLMGIIWFGKEQIPTTQKNYQFTFAIRLYGDARGKGNALPFMKNAVKKFKKTDDYRRSALKGFWLATNSDNLPAIKAYENFGFKIVPNMASKRILMVAEKL